MAQPAIGSIAPRTVTARYLAYGHLSGPFERAMSATKGRGERSFAAIEETLVRAPSQEPMKIGTVDVEEFSRNLARLVEEGGRALAAYLKPREEGRRPAGHSPRR